MTKTWKDYEEFVFVHLKKQYPGYTFVKNDSIRGRFSETLRQIDISMRTKIAGNELLMVVECKCFNKKLNVKDVELFLGLMEDVGAHHGVLISNKGFSVAAGKRAQSKRLGIWVYVIDGKEWDTWATNHGRG